MLPREFRYRLFDEMSVKTMRYVHAIDADEASPLGAAVLHQLAEDFFVNGSITSHSARPELMAGVWVGGRETVLVDDHLDRLTKEAMSAVLSRANDCAYCGDMLISLTHGRQSHGVARGIFDAAESDLPESQLSERLRWAEAAARGGHGNALNTPFSTAELPEAIGTVFVFSYINRVSHVLMDGSPVDEPLGSRTLKAGALRLFGRELREVSTLVLEPGRSLSLLPPAPLPDGLAWAKPNPRIADALSRWVDVVEREASAVIPASVAELVAARLSTWEGELMPISRSWVERDVAALEGRERDIARLVLLTALASTQVSDDVVLPVLGSDRDEGRLVTVLSWASMRAARRIGQLLARRSGDQLPPPSAQPKAHTPNTSSITPSLG